MITVVLYRASKHVVHFISIKARCWPARSHVGSSSPEWKPGQNASEVQLTVDVDCDVFLIMYKHTVIRVVSDLFHIILSYLQHYDRLWPNKLGENCCSLHQGKVRLKGKQNSIIMV